MMKIYNKTFLTLLLCTALISTATLVNAGDDDEEDYSPIISPNIKNENVQMTIKPIENADIENIEMQATMEANISDAYQMLETREPITAMRIPSNSASMQCDAWVRKPNWTAFTLVPRGLHSPLLCNVLASYVGRFTADVDQGFVFEQGYSKLVGLDLFPFPSPEILNQNLGGTVKGLITEYEAVKQIIPGISGNERILMCKAKVVNVDSSAKPGAEIRIYYDLFHDQWESCENLMDDEGSRLMSKDEKEMLEAANALGLKMRCTDDNICPNYAGELCAQMSFHKQIKHAEMMCEYLSLAAANYLEVEVSGDPAPAGQQYIEPSSIKIFKTPPRMRL